MASTLTCFMTSTMTRFYDLYNNLFYDLYYDLFSAFQNQEEPTLDFKDAPPGLLALDNMIYFAQRHKETYIKVGFLHTNSSKRKGSLQHAKLS